MVRRGREMEARGPGTLNALILLPTSCVSRPPRDANHDLRPTVCLPWEACRWLPAHGTVMEASGFLSERIHPRRNFGTLKGSAPGASFVNGSGQRLWGALPWVSFQSTGLTKWAVASQFRGSWPCAGIQGDVTLYCIICMFCFVDHTVLYMYTCRHTQTFSVRG